MRDDEQLSSGFVTWSALEDALKGLRELLPAETTSAGPVVVAEEAEAETSGNRKSVSSAE